MKSSINKRIVYVALVAIAMTVACLAGSDPPPSFELTKEQIETYDRDGFIVVRGLLKGKQLEDAIQAAQHEQKSKSIFDQLLYKLFPLYNNLGFQIWRKYSAMESVAFDSDAPKICAKLMGLEEENNSGKTRPLRLLKDTFMAFRTGDVGCGWHTDDKAFWPCEDRNIGERDAGVNVWISLSNVSKVQGGGFAVAKGSHRASFAEKARQAIREGKYNTCHLEKLDPESHGKMEDAKAVTFDLEPGDAIFHNRYTFHRGDPFVLNDSENYQQQKVTNLRISLRYVPADATFFNSGFGIDRAAEVKGLKTGDAVSNGQEYYPQVWPQRLDEERAIKVLPDRPLLTFGGLIKSIFKGEMKEED